MFSAYCLQNHEYFHSGRNSETKEDCVYDIISYLISGDGTDEDWSKLSGDTIMEIFEVEIHEHESELIDGNKDISDIQASQTISL